MNELNELSKSSLKPFDYNEVDQKTADFLKAKVKNMQKIADDTRYRMGKELAEAQDRLANNYKGTFIKWFTSLGLDRNNVYFWINEFKFSRNLENSQQAINFGNAPKTLKQDIMKSDAPEPAKTAVLNGDITTHKEYQRLVAKLKAKDQELADSKAENDDLQAENSNMRKQQVELNQRLAAKDQPKVVERTVTKEVKPDDYDDMKRQLRELQQDKTKLAKKVDDQQSEIDSYKDLQTQERQAQHWQNRGRISIYKLTSNTRDYMRANTLTTDDKKAIADASEEALTDLNDCLDDLQKMIDGVRELTNGRRIVEGEIIND